jgi:hypothetical protein
MAHANRSRRKANQARREASVLRQTPLPLGEQRGRAIHAESKSAERYPEPPVYEEKRGRKPRTQPACYLGVDPLAAVLAAIAMQSRRRS